MKDNTQYLPFAGRFLIGGIFILSGFSKLGSYDGTVAAIARRPVDRILGSDQQSLVRTPAPWPCIGTFSGSDGNGRSPVPVSRRSTSA